MIAKLSFFRWPAYLCLTHIMHLSKVKCLVLLVFESRKILWISRGVDPLALGEGPRESTLTLRLCRSGWCPERRFSLIFPTIHFQERTVTLPETNIAPKNWWLEYSFVIGGGLFSGAVLNLRRVVSGRVVFRSGFCCWKDWSIENSFLTWMKLKLLKSCCHRCHRVFCPKTVSTSCVKRKLCAKNGWRPLDEWSLMILWMAEILYHLGCTM